MAWQKKDNENDIDKDNDRNNDKDNPRHLWHLKHYLQFWHWNFEFMTIFVAWQLRVTMDSIRNSLNVFLIEQLTERQLLRLASDSNQSKRGQNQNIYKMSDLAK